MASKRATFFLRLTSTLVLWGVILGIVVAQNEFGYFALIAFLSLVALWEYFHMLKLDGIECFRLTGMVTAGAFLVGSFAFLHYLGPASSNDFQVATLVAFLMIVFARQMFEQMRDRDALQTMAYTLFGLFYIPWLFNFLQKIIYLAPHAADGTPTGQWYVLYLVAVTKFSDAGAYAFGSLFGKHPFMHHISPKKTWEGFVGALISSLIASWWVYGLTATHLASFGFIDVTILGLTLGFAAVVGDLAESIIKRSAHAKDSSKFLPGIGGSLDLIDSLLFTGPILYFYMRAVLGMS